MQSREITLNFYPDAIPSFHIKKAVNRSAGESVHYHDFYQIYFISHGALTFYYLGKTKILGKGDIFIVSPQTAHRIELSYGVELYSISFFPSFLSEKYKASNLIDFLNSIQTINEKNGELIWPQIILPAELRQTCEGFCQIMLDEFSSRKDNFEQIIFGIMVSLLTLLERSYTISQGLQEYTQKHETARKEVLQYIDTLKNSFTEKLTLNSASQATLISKPLFCKIFLEVTGMTFNHYLNKLRIDYSIKLITTTTLSIVDISEKSGYSDFSTFYRNFMRVTGISPSDYKDVFYNHSYDNISESKQ